MQATVAAPAVSLQQASAFLDRMSSDCEGMMASLGHEFETLAEHVTELLRLAGLTVDSINAETVSQVPAKVQMLVEATGQLIGKKFEATSAVLQMVKNEERLLEKLLGLNAGNRSVAQELRMLSLLTNIEVEHLGDLGFGFRYLARELQKSSDSVSDGAVEFAAHAVSRKAAVHDGQRKVATALPRLQKQFEGIRAQLEQALGSVNESVEELSACPAQFKTAVETVSGHISGVVSAIQSHDITRQQTEHVQDALGKISSRRRDQDAESITPELSLGLKIQAFQLRNIQETMEAWCSQIDQCLESILAISNSRLAQVVPAVISQERELSARLLEVEQLERECEKDSGEVEEALQGLATLMELIGQQFSSARLIRDRLQLVSFNSIIEASNLGSKADVMLEISKNITRVSSQWGAMTDRSENTKSEIQTLLDRARESIRSFDQEGREALASAREEIGAALGDLRGAAQCAAANGDQIGELTRGLHERIHLLRSKSQSLKVMAADIGKAREEIEAVQGPVDDGLPPESGLDQLEQQYSAAYTTEKERQILRAALFGEPMPAAETVIVGNEVELF